MTGITLEQHNQLLAPINGRRVGRRDGQSHLEAYDVRAHLTRIFGFGGWSGDVLDIALLFEQPATLGNGKPGFRVGYRCTYRLTIHATGATYTEAATGDGNMPEGKRADAHDFAIKTAESQALKRCAINLGDQFGLSLYNGGSVAPLVGRTLAVPHGVLAHGKEKPVDAHVTHISPEDSPAGQAEPEVSTPPAPAAAPARQAAPPDDHHAGIVDDLRARALKATTKRALAGLLADAAKEGVGGALTTDADGKGLTLETLINRRIREVA